MQYHKPISQAPVSFGRCPPCPPSKSSETLATQGFPSVFPGGRPPSEVPLWGGRSIPPSTLHTNPPFVRARRRRARPRLRGQEWSICRPSGPALPLTALRASIRYIQGSGVHAVKHPIAIRSPCPGAALLPSLLGLLPPPQHIPPNDIQRGLQRGHVGLSLHQLGLSPLTT